MARRFWCDYPPIPHGKVERPMLPIVQQCCNRLSSVMNGRQIGKKRAASGVTGVNGAFRGLSGAYFPKFSFHLSWEVKLNFCSRCGRCWVTMLQSGSIGLTIGFIARPSAVCGRWFGLFGTWIGLIRVCSGVALSARTQTSWPTLPWIVADESDASARAYRYCAMGDRLQ